MQNKNVEFRDLGSIDYQEAWTYQEDLLKSSVQLKMENRKNEGAAPQLVPNYLLFCEHPHVFTLGKSGDFANLLLNETQLAEKSATFYKINRGGDITYHGPGQIVGYPIFDLDNFKPDLHLYLRNLEEAVILTLGEYGLEAGRIEKLTGVWLHRETDDPKKILAIGVRCSRWVTMHGFAFNVNTNLDYFGYIIPCGIDDKGVTSLQQELGREMDMAEVTHKLKENLKRVFEFEWVK